jgi:hypothetical protein
MATLSDAVMFSVRGAISPHASRTLQGLRSYRGRLAVLQSTRLRVYFNSAAEHIA